MDAEPNANPTGVTQHTWEKFCSIAVEALGVEAVDRSRFVASACGDDLELRSRVELLLLKANGASGFLEGGLNFGLSLRPRAAGDVVGNYVLDELIGKGGMGEVWSAHRTDGQFEQRVAVKLLSAGFPDAWRAKRFREERQILAGFEHPNIARLLDGGLASDGSPFLAMELVEGERSDTAIERLPVVRRLELFEKICHAVQYAHQRLIVHRDIKPSNILIAQNGEPKLLDFGIARSLDPLDMSATQTGLGAFTPNYASPEQIQGQPMGTSTDVYSLGVVLFEWVAGRKSYELAGKSLAEIVDIVCHHGVPPADSGTPELDAVIRKAVRIDPAERYQSAAELASDIRLYLEGRPVSARPSTSYYRFRKFVTRNRAACAVAAAAAVALSVSGAMVVIQWREAQRQRIEAQERFNGLRKLAKSVMFDLHDAVAPLEGSTKAREMIVREALGYMDPLADRAANDPSLAAELISGYTRMGRVEMSQMGAALGDAIRARVSYDKAVALAERSLTASPSDKSLLEAAAFALKERGGLRVDLQNYSAALTDFDRAIEINHKLGAAIALRAVLNAKAQALTDIDPERALPIYQELLGHYESDHRADPRAARPRFGMTTMEMNLGSVYRSLGKTSEAENRYRRAIDVGDKLCADYPNETRFRGNLRLSYAYLAQMLTSGGRPEEAVPFMTRNLELLRQLDKDAGDKTFLTSVGLAYADLGNLEIKRGRISEGRAAYETAIAKYREAVAAMPAIPQYRARLAMALHLLGATFREGDCRRCAAFREGAAAASSVPSREGLSGSEKSALSELPRKAAACATRCR